MRVGIDTAFLSLPPSGTGTYLRALMLQLPDVDPELELVPLRPPPAPQTSRRWHDPRLGRARWELHGAGSAAARAKVDLLHIPSLAAPFRTSIPLVVTVHDAIPFALPEYRASRAMALHLRLLRYTVRRATLILTPSWAAADDISRLLPFPRDRIRVTPEAAGPDLVPAVDPGASRAVATRFGLTGPYLFTIAGFDKRKNLPLLLEAFARARPELPAGTKLAIGGAPHGANPTVNPPLEPHLDRLGLRPQVVLTGRVSEPDKIALYQAAALYVTPSEYEGFGLTALEAMACGTPVIAANRSSLPEVTGHAALLVEPEVEAVRGAIVQVFANLDLAAGLRTRGLAQAARFSWRETARLTAAAYHDALELANFGEQRDAG